MILFFLSPHNIFPKHQGYNQTRFNILIVCPLTDLYRQTLESRISSHEGEFIPRDLLPRKGSILRASRFIGTWSSKALLYFLTFSLSLFLSLCISFSENFSKTIKFHAHTKYKDFKSGRGRGTKAERKDVVLNVRIKFPPRERVVWIMQVTLLKLVSLTFENIIYSI